MSIFVILALAKTVYMYGDDSATLYVDNNQVLSQTYPNIVTSVISSASSLLALSVYNVNGLTGAILSLTYGGCLTNSSSWRCTDTLYSNWNQINYDDSSWPLAFIKMQNKDLYGGPYAQFASTCPVMGTSITRDYAYNYCRLWLN